MATATTGHKHPDYMKIFWALAILTVVEIALVFLPMGKLVIGTGLVVLAVWKAALVAMYFMHLRFETKTLGWIAVTPLAIATLLVFLLLPDGMAIDHKTPKTAAPGASAPAKQ
jgi:cytochrome c oxidase subunit 4